MCLQTMLCKNQHGFVPTRMRRISKSRVRVAVDLALAEIDLTSGERAAVLGLSGRCAGAFTNPNWGSTLSVTLRGPGEYGGKFAGHERAWCIPGNDR